MKTHVIVRTSPKGQEFIGRCLMCGRDNMAISDANTDCDGELMSLEDAVNIAMTNPNGPKKITKIYRID